MTISKRVQHELSLAATPQARLELAPLTMLADEPRLLFIDVVESPTKGKAWTNEEHERFLEALDLFPKGPWKAIAAYVGTKTARQTMTHAQKYRQKMQRRQRGLRNHLRKRKEAMPQPKESPRSADDYFDDRVVMEIIAELEPIEPLTLDVWAAPCFPQVDLSDTEVLIG